MLVSGIWDRRTLVGLYGKAVQKAKNETITSALMLLEVSK